MREKRTIPLILSVFSRNTSGVQTRDFDFVLPAGLIAQVPLPVRDQSRLLVLHRQEEKYEHRSFRDILDFLDTGDVLVLNNSRVLPARLHGYKPDSGGQIEILLVEQVETLCWWAMVRPGKRVRPGTRLQFYNHAGQTTAVTAVVLEKNAEGHVCLQFSGTADLIQDLSFLGEPPLPPYIVRSTDTLTVNDRERYQTIFAQVPGSVAAPTAGLHFTPELLAKIQQRGVKVCFVTLHVGLGTFAPVKTQDLSQHPMHQEHFELSAESTEAIRSAKLAGHRVVAAGTTTVRVLESVAAENDGQLRPTRGHTRLFIYPPYQFRVVDRLLTNFHLPQSTLLMLVCAFAAPQQTTGRQLVLNAYAEAIRQNYRFFSYGDAMLLE
jgi:S-adenosylmethionine:tRNA ribosyltransferase-isomerase